MSSEEDNVEKNVKPRKLFEVKMNVWDDGIITTDYTEFNKTDRGTKKWSLRQHEFALAVKAMCGEGIGKLLNTQVDVDIDGE